MTLQQTTWYMLTSTQRNALIAIFNGGQPPLAVVDGLIAIGFVGVRNGDEFYLSEYGMSVVNSAVKAAVDSASPEPLGELETLRAENGRRKSELGNYAVKSFELFERTMGVELDHVPDPDELLHLWETAVNTQREQIRGLEMAHDVVSKQLADLQIAYDELGDRYELEE